MEIEILDIGVNLLGWASAFMIQVGSMILVGVGLLFATTVIRLGVGWIVGYRLAAIARGEEIRQLREEWGE